jgi:hypothetical protein
MMVRIVAVFVGALVAFGCKNAEECEKARFALSKTWRGLTEASGKRELAGVDSEGWRYMKGRAALLESSFMTTQVTWDSADKARKDLTERLPGLQSDAAANVQGYRLSIHAALKQQDDFAAQCR